MGIFEKVLQEQQPEAIALTPHQAFCRDHRGKCQHRRQHLGGRSGAGQPALRSHPAVSSAARGGASAGTRRGHGADSPDGAGAVVELAAKALPPPLHAAAFALEVDLVLADGQTGADERKFIDTLQGLLQIDDQAAIKIVEVMLMKNSA